MVGGEDIDRSRKSRPEKTAEESKDTGELEELKHNLKVSFSRMKEDIQSNRQETGEMRGYIEDLVKTNKILLEQVTSLKDEIKALKERPKGLKTELMRSLARNQKALIKQRILSMVIEGRYSIPELKERIVDDRNYCSKASFYRYIEELKSSRKIDFLSIEGREVVVELKEGESAAAPKQVKREDFV